MIKRLYLGFAANRVQRRNAVFPKIVRVKPQVRPVDVFEPRLAAKPPTIAQLLADQRRASWKQKPESMATKHAKAMDAAAGRKNTPAEYDTFVTRHAPNDYLGFAEGWQERLPGKASADAVARFNRLRNSLDHYAYYFATSKEARVSYRNAYAEMRAIYLQMSKERYVFSPHDAEEW